jgi:hypothetical protein
MWDIEAPTFSRQSAHRWRYGFMTSALGGGEWSASRLGCFTPVERVPGTHWIGGWVERRKILPLPGLELRPLGRPARSQSLYWRRVMVKQVIHNTVLCRLRRKFTSAPSERFSFSLKTWLIILWCYSGAVETRSNAFSLYMNVEGWIGTGLHVCP